jgi:hypothetical protein
MLGQTLQSARNASNQAITQWEDGLLNINEARQSIASNWICVRDLDNDEITNLMCSYLDILEILSQLDAIAV